MKPSSGIQSIPLNSSPSGLLVAATVFPLHHELIAHVHDPCACPYEPGIQHSKPSEATQVVVKVYRLNTVNDLA